MSVESIVLDTRTILLMAGCFALAVSGWVYGLKFLKHGNHCLGYEYLIMGTSGLNFLFYAATESQTSYGILVFLDAFSRAFGFPVLATMGLMVLTHKFKPSIRLEISVFAVTITLTAMMVGFDFMRGALPYIYLTAWILFACYLSFFTKLLFEAGQNWVGWLVIFSTVSSTLIAVIYDFFRIPGEETNVVLNFYFLALVTWSYAMAVLWYAYRRLENMRSQATAIE